MKIRWFPFHSSGAGVLTLDRLNALTDGTVAIVLTLLVLGIDIPQNHNFSKDGLLSFLMKIEYAVTVYGVSFVVIGSYWVQQNVMFLYFRNVTRKLIWLNLTFLFLLTLIPFTTKLMATYRYQPLVVVIYGAVNIICGLSLALIWWYGSGRAPVIWPKVDPAVARSLFVRTLMGPLLSLVAIGAAFINVRLAHVIFLMTPLLYLSHRTVDSHWSEVVEQNSHPSGTTEFVNRETSG